MEEPTELEQEQQQKDERGDGKTVRRAPDGKVYRRIIKREPLTADEWLTYTRLASCSFFHWCNGPNPELLTVHTPPHVCDIWDLAPDDETNGAPPPRKRRRPARPTLPELLERVMYTQEETAVEPVPLLRRVEVIASIYQAEALEKAAGALEEISDALDRLIYLDDLTDYVRRIADALEALNTRPMAKLYVPPSSLVPPY